MKARFGRYVLLKKLAAGGMAEVFLARRLSFGGFAKFVVIKRLLPEYSKRKAYVRLFLAEARTGAQLNHPNIVGLHDLGQIDDAYFMAMEYVHGVSAAELLARAQKARKPVPIGVALRIVGSVAEALQYAHHAPDLDGEPLGIIHHDISPQNVQISFDGDVKLLDFGVSTRRGQQPTGGRRGKYAYMSPEAIARGELDQRSDLFSLGVVLYELTTGRRLFKGDATEPPADATARREIEPPTKVDGYYPASLEEVVLKVLAHDPAARFADAGTFHKALVEVGRKLGAATGADALAAYVAELFAEEIPKRRAELAELARRSDPKPKAPAEPAAEKAARVESADEKPPPSTDDEAAAEKPSPPLADGGAPAEAPVAEANKSEEAELDDEDGAADDLDDGAADGPEPAFEAPAAVLNQAPRWDEALHFGAAASWRRAAVALAIGGLVLAAGTFFLGRHWGESAVRAAEDLDHGSLVVESTPEGARVYDGEKLLGMTPIDAGRVPVGTRYDLRIVHPGHRDFRRQVEIRPERRHVVVTAGLEPEAAAAPSPPSSAVADGNGVRPGAPVSTPR